MFGKTDVEFELPFIQNIVSPSVNFILVKSVLDVEKLQVEVQIQSIYSLKKRKGSIEMDFEVISVIFSNLPNLDTFFKASYRNKK